jgi:hypothetical protein
MSTIGKQVVVDDSGPNLIESERFAVLVNQDGANSVFLGGQDVTAADGYELKPNDQVALDFALDAVYGICATGLSARVDVLAVRRSYR